MPIFVDMTLKEKIIARGLKQNYIASQIGIKYPTLNKYLNGNRTMPNNVHNKIVHILKWM